MTAKTLEQEVKGLNDGLVSMDVVKEAPGGNLPAVRDDEVIPKLGEKATDDIGEKLEYMCMQAGIKNDYAKKMKKYLDEVLDGCDFIKKDEHYERVREGFVDYLFLNKFLDKGSFGISVKFEDHKQFEHLFSEPEKGKYSPGEKAFTGLIAYGFLGAFVGVCLGSVGEVWRSEINGFSMQHFNFGDLFEYLFYGSLGLGLISGPIRNYLLEKRNKITGEKKYTDEMEEYNATKDRFVPHAVSNDKKYDFGVINHFLQLTPKQILDNND